MSVICFVRQSVHSKSVQAGKGRIPIVGKHFELNISKFWYGGRLNPKVKKTSLKYLVTAVTIIGGINLEALFYPHLYRKILKSVSSITIQILAQ